MEKLHFGLLCNHWNEVHFEGIAYTVECSDGCVDVCIQCFERGRLIDDTNNPYTPRKSPYWYNGTMRELLIYLNSIIE